MKTGLDWAAKSLSIRQRQHETRLAWLRGLKTGDLVMLAQGGSDRPDSACRVHVTRHTNGSLYVPGHPRRDLRSGKWERGGKAWLHLRIDPVTP